MAFINIKKYIGLKKIEIICGSKTTKVQENFRGYLSSVPSDFKNILFLKITNTADKF